MKKIKFILILFIGIIFMGCDENSVYEKHKGGFTDYRWENTKLVEFNPEVKDIEQDYQIYFSLRHVLGFQFKYLNINLEVTSPSGEVTSKDYVLKIIGEGSNKLLSECALDICDLDILMEENFKFTETGKYKYVVKHIMETNPIPNVMQIGLKIRKTTTP